MENAKHQSVQEVREQRLSVGTKAIFGMGDYLNTVTYGMIAAFLMAFLTDTIMIPMAAVTAIMSLSKLWDAVNDPIIGVIIDKSRSRWGVYRPWVLFGAIPFAISNIIIWAVPFQLDDDAHPVAVGLVPDVGDALQPLVLHQIGRAHV